MPEGMPELPKAKINQHAILVQNQKDIRKNVDQLYDLAGKLRKQVHSTDSSEVLSLDMIQTANDIQKLAKKIVDLAKG